MHSTIKSLLYRSSAPGLYQNFQLGVRWYVKKIAVHEVPLNISSASIKRTLKAHSIPFEDGHACLVIQCIICSKLNKVTAESKIHINKTTGAFICSCNYAGQWDEIRQSFSAQNTKCESARDSKMLEDMRQLEDYLAMMSKETVLVNTLAKDVQDDIIQKFDLKALPSVFDVLDIRTNADRSVLYFPVRSAARATVGYATLPAVDNNTVEPQLAHLPLGGAVYGSVRRAGARDAGALVVPAVRDLMALLSQPRGVRETVVVAPNGLATLSQFVLPCFEEFGRVTLWLGGDGAAWDAARTFARKLGEKRCLVVPSALNHKPIILPSQQQQQQDVAGYRAILDAAQPLWHKAITNFASLRDDVLSDLMNVDRVRGVPWRRFPTLTAILRGHRRGELTVLTGPTGCGKTTFMSEYSLDLAEQGINTLWGSFEIRNARLARTMLQQHARIKLDDHLTAFDSYADAFQLLPIYYMTFHGPQPLRTVMDAIEHAVYVHDIAHVIIDNVQFMLGVAEVAPGDRFQRQDQVVAAFRTLATQRDCHVTLVIHPRKEKVDELLTAASIFGGAKASQEADNVLILQDGRLSSLRGGKKYLQVVKNRYSGDLGIMPLDFNKDALSFEQKKKPTTTRQTKETGRPKRVAAAFFDSDDEGGEGEAV